jgi:two-component system response regulator YesN
MMKDPKHLSASEQHALIINHLEAFLTTLTPPNPNWPDPVIQMVLYIHKHLFDKDLSASRVEAGCGINNHETRTLFKLYVQATIRAYIVHLRLRAALDLLRDARLDIAQIGFCVGYKSPRTFTRIFKQAFGMPPSAVGREVERF